MKETGRNNGKIQVSGIQVEWNPQRGTCSFEKLPVAMMWVDTTLAGLMSGVQAMVGTERFALALQSEGRKSVESDWQAISQFPDFREGFKAIANIAAVAGWGKWALTVFDEERKECRFRVADSWEGRYQRSLGVCWGSGMLAGKLAGYCSKIFGSNCWAEQTAFIAKGDPCDEFIVKPSPRSIEKEVDTLLATGEATQADMAVALRRLEQEIAERKRTEELLRESEERLKKILDSFDVGVAILDANTHEILSINPKALSLFGAPEEQVVGRACHQYICPALKGKCPISDLGQTLDASERTLLTAAGKQIPIIKSVVRMKLHSQDCLVESFVDITPRKQAEEALEKSLSLLQATFDSTADGILVVARNGKVTTFNSKFLALWRIPDSLTVSRDESQLLQSVLDQLRNPEVFMEKVKSLYAHPEAESYDVLEFKDGRVFERFSKPQRIAEEIVGRVWSFRDVTERRRVEKELQTSEEKYRLLIQNSNDAIFIAQDGVIKFPNLRTEQFLGYSAMELAEIPFIKHLHPDDRAMVVENHKKRLGGQNLPSTYCFRAKNKSGEDLWAEINAVRIPWEGEPATLNFVRDITEKKKLEAQYLQAQKMEAVGTLAGGVAHDFNNLLMGIQGHTSLMLLEKDPADPHYKMLKTIEEQVKNGADLTWQLLSFARGGKYEVKPTDLNAIVKKTAAMFGRTKKEIRIQTSFQQELWPVEVGQGQIDQVLLNLYVNAWQAMPNGGTLFIETRNVSLDETYRKPFAVRPGNYVKISVTDTGVGMDEKTLKRIFEPFFTTKEMGRGTGLGLATAYGIIKGHGGIINAYSEKGHGATFTIYLPASEKNVEKEKSGPAQPLKGQGTILLVDDEPAILNVNRMVLERLGYKVFMAQNGGEAIEVFRIQKDAIDLVILDMIMPGMEGGKVFELLKEIQPEVKVILSSGYSINHEVTAMMERGCRAFIQKPFDIGTFSKKIREVLGGGEMSSAPTPTSSSPAP